MERIVAVLTEKQQAFVRAVGFTSVSTPRARLTCIVGIHLDGHRSVQERFVGNHALQFGKRPLGVGCIGLPLLLRGLFAMLVPGALSDVYQVLKSDQAMWVSGHNALGDHMIGVLLQPSLSSADRHQATGSRTSAFLLQTLSQSRIMV